MVICGGGVFLVFGFLFIDRIGFLVGLVRFGLLRSYGFLDFWIVLFRI